MICDIGVFLHEIVILGRQMRGPGGRFRLEIVYVNMYALFLYFYQH